MRTTSLAGFTTGAAFATLAAILVPSQAGQEPKQPSPADMAKMMEKAKRFTEPGDKHELLHRFLGTWDHEFRFWMGSQSMPPEKGTSEFTWLMTGRWLQSRWQGTMMNKPAEGVILLGYDNFKMSYVSTMVSSMDTAMTHSEGDLDPNGKALILYGTLDEYLTGENDKMVKYVWRFPTDDTMTFEVHDLAIGEKDTKVIEVSYTRRK